MTAPVNNEHYHFADEEYIRQLTILSLLNRAVLLSADESTPEFLRAKNAFLKNAASYPVSSETGMDVSPFDALVSNTYSLSRSRYPNQRSLPFTDEAMYLMVLPEHTRTLGLSAEKMQAELGILLEKALGKKPDASIQKSEVNPRRDTIKLMQHSYDDRADMLSCLKQSQNPAISALVAGVEKHQSKVRAQAFPSGRWMRSKILSSPDYTPAVLPDHGQTLHIFPQDGSDTSKDGILVSRGFETCSALIIYNEKTQTTTAMHIAGGEFSDGQARLLQQLAKQGGAKHAVLLQGDRWENGQNMARSTAKITLTLEKWVPDIIPHGTLVVTRDKDPVHWSKNYHCWDMALNAKNGILTITEKRGERTEPVEESHSFPLMPELYAKKNPGLPPLDMAIPPEIHDAYTGGRGLGAEEVGERSKASWQQRALTQTLHSASAKNAKSLDVSRR
jgi:hypothetical protein